jgi:hypothetical protein
LYEQGLPLPLSEQPYFVGQTYLGDREGRPYDIIPTALRLFGVIHIERLSAFF